jgi:hypothetical protein
MTISVTKPHIFAQSLTHSKEWGSTIFENKSNFERPTAMAMIVWYCKLGNFCEHSLKRISRPLAKMWGLVTAWLEQVTLDKMMMMFALYHALLDL